MSNQTTAPRPPKSGRRALRYLPLLLIAAALVAAYALGLHEYLSFEALKAQRHGLALFVAGQPLVAAAAFVTVFIGLTLLMIPGVALWMTMTAGFLFGLPAGVGLSLAGVTLGASALFLLARSTLGKPLHRHAGPFLRRIEAGFQENPFSYMLAMRVLPVMPYPVSNVAPALLGARLRDFAPATLLGFIPGAIAYGLVGSGLGAAFDSGVAPDMTGFMRPLLPAFSRWPRSRSPRRRSSGGGNARSDAALTTRLEVGRAIGDKASWTGEQFFVTSRRVRPATSAACRGRCSPCPSPW